MALTCCRVLRSVSYDVNYRLDDCVRIDWHATLFIDRSRGYTLVSGLNPSSFVTMSTLTYRAATGEPSSDGEKTIRSERQELTKPLT